MYIFTDSKNLERNGTIRLKFKVENEVLLISIEDDGMGMTKEQVDNLIMKIMPGKQL